MYFSVIFLPFLPVISLEESGEDRLVELNNGNYTITGISFASKQQYQWKVRDSLLGPSVTVQRLLSVYSIE